MRQTESCSDFTDYLIYSFPQLQIWDTAGQERFRSITQSYYRSANALILTYDITCEDSFRCLPEWLREIEQYANNQVVTILVGEYSSFN
uniref:small monomeric GTPase n=1 Tax=Cyprinus carpio TaxID=7962 RepID=A0A8C2F6H5_CYPCA